MNTRSELTRRTRAEVVRRPSRELVRAAGQVHDEVILAEYEVDGSLKLAEHIMDGLSLLDKIRQHYAGDDPVQQMLMADVMATAVRQVTGIQRQLYTSW